MPHYQEVFDPSKPKPSGETYGPITKWKETGQVVEGLYSAKRSGKYGLLYQIGDTTVPGTTALNGKMNAVRIGDQVRVTYLGRKRAESGVEYQNFKVEVATATGAAPVTGTGHTEFDLLLSRIRVQKGEEVAKNLKAAALVLSDDPLASLRELAKQVGIDEEVPF